MVGKLDQNCKLCEGSSTDTRAVDGRLVFIFLFGYGHGNAGRREWTGRVCVVCVSASKEGFQRFGMVLMKRCVFVSVCCVRVRE